MNITYRAIGLLLAATIGVAALAEDESRIRMGLILPLSGPHAQTAAAMRNAAELAYENLPAASRQKFELAFEDDQLNGMLAVSAFEKFMASGNIAAALTFGGQSVAALAPLAAARRVPVLALTADSSLVRGKTFVFQHWLTSDEQAGALARALEHELSGRKRAALVASTHNAALDIKSKFKGVVEKRGLDTVYDNEFLPAETDFRAVLSHIKKSSPDLLLTVLLAPQMGLFARQMRQAGMSITCFSSANAEISSEVLSSQGAMEGLLYAGPDLNPDFIRQFEAKYHTYPEFAAPHVYDSVQLVAAAIARGAGNGEQINAALLKVRDFQGAMGNYSLEGGFRFGVKAVPKKIRDGKFVRIEK